MTFDNFKRLYAPPGARLFQKGQSGVVKLDELTSEAWQGHIGNGPHIGAYVRQENGTVGFSMFDIDIWPREVPREEMLRQMAELKPKALRAMVGLEALGVARKQVLVEFSGTGYHLWLFYTEPVPASLARDLMKKACARAETKLIFKPNNLRVTDKDTVWLPLRINANQHIRSVFVTDLESFDPGNYIQEAELRPLEMVQTLSREDAGRLSR